MQILAFFRFLPPSHCCRCPMLSCSPKLILFPGSPSTKLWYLWIWEFESVRRLTYEIINQAEIAFFWKIAKHSNTLTSILRVKKCENRKKSMVHFLRPAIHFFIPIENSRIFKIQFFRFFFQFLAIFRHILGKFPTSGHVHNMKLPEKLQRVMD